jgi:uncharacterized protein (DUF302 family)
MSNNQYVGEIAGTTEGLHVVRQRYVVEVAFDAFTASLESMLTRFDPADQQAAGGVGNTTGEPELMIYMILDHGAARDSSGRAHKVKLYLIGNPSIAGQMVRQQIRAALYAPLRVLIYENSAGDTVAEYDQMSSLVQQHGDDEVSEAATQVDQQLLAVLRRAVDLSAG